MVTDSSTTSPLWPRAVLHVDLDAFYAAVEELDDPSLRGKPLIIGSPSSRGVVSTANYIARQFGVHSAMPSVQALQKCPHAEWRPTRMERYKEFSLIVRSIVEEITDQFEPLGLDEFFMEVTGSQRLLGTPEVMAKNLKQGILDKTKLNASVGAAENKFLAKVASDLEKPDGLTVVPYGKGAEFLAPLPLKRLWGVGPKTEAIIRELGIQTIGNLSEMDRDLLKRRIGEASADHVLALSKGMDSRFVITDSRPKSIGRENTYSEDLFTQEDIERELLFLADAVSARLRASRLAAEGMTLKVRLGSFQTFSRSVIFPEPTNLTDVLYQEAKVIIKNRIDRGNKGIRLLGIQGTRLKSDRGHSEYLFHSEDSDKKGRAEQAIDSLRDKFGRAAVKRGRLVHPPKRKEDKTGEETP